MAVAHSSHHISRIQWTNDVFQKRVNPVDLPAHAVATVYGSVLLQMLPSMHAMQHPMRLVVLGGR
jgi:hypothetical protein